MFLELGDEMAALDMHSDAPAPAPSGQHEPWMEYADPDELFENNQDFAWPVDDDSTMDTGKDHESGDSPLKKKTRGEYGDVDRRWSQRLLKSTIMDDLARGCSCGCVGKLSYDEVFAARTERSHEDGLSGNRAFIRAYLKDNKNSGKKLGYNLHADDGAKELCPIGFDMLHGFARGYTYRYIRALDRGEVADDPNLGGKRVGTGRPASAHGSIAGDAFADDTIQAMSFRGWWTDLRNDTELMPTVDAKKRREIDYIEEKELYNECVADLLDSGLPKECIGDQACAARHA